MKINLGVGTGGLTLNMVGVLTNNFGLPAGVPPESVPFCPCGCGCGSSDGGQQEAPAPLSSDSLRMPRERGEAPVRLSTGELIFRADDLASGGFGAPWGHSRGFASRLSDDDDIGQGYNWLVAQLPYLVCVDCNKLVLMGRPSQNLWFDDNGDGSFTTRHGFKEQLTSNGGGLVLTGTDGSQTSFAGLDATPPGVFESYTDPAGNQTKIVSRVNTFYPGEVQRSSTDQNGDTTVESYQYNYEQGGDAGLRFSSVILRRRINSGSWTNVRQATYTYWNGSNSYGAVGDLKTATTQSWENNAWADLGTTLYRYYLPKSSTTGGSSGSSSSSAIASSSSSSSSATPGPVDGRDRGHLLKYVVKPDAYARLSADPNSGSDPTVASDSLVAQYADYYIEYDSNRCPTLVMLEGGSRSYAYGFALSNDDVPANPDYNAWKGVTTETLPGGTQNTVYANAVGQVMLAAKTAGAAQAGNGPWYEYYRYDANAKMVLLAESSAITGYSAAAADLLNCQPIVSSSSSSSSGVCNCPPICSGNLQYLADHTGLIHLYDYDSASGHAIRERIRNGEFGCDNKLWERSYLAYFVPQSSASSSASTGSSSSAASSSSASSISSSSSGSSASSGSSGSSASSSGGTPSGGGSPPTIYPIRQLIQYPDDITVDPNQSRQIVTSYDYTFISLRIQSRTTTWPVVSTAQNGSGVADSRTEYFDVYGNPTWTKDERGYLTRQQYDPVTGGILQTIQDVDTTQTTDQPAGWTTPSGGGLHLVTDYTVDNLGRTTQVLGPSHEIDLAGVATTIRRATWSVYLDSLYQQYSGQGYATGTVPSYSYTLVNPVSIAKFDRAGRVLEQISAIRSSTAGALSASDSFPQSSYCRWTTNQFTDCCKQASSRNYFAILASGEGSVGVNYNETDFGYDFLNRRNRVVSPGGTITRTVFDARNLPIAVYVGTNDTGATAGDPTGGGAIGNNMVVVTEYQYDSGAAGGDGNLTQETQHVDATTSRVTAYGYDYRNRRTFTDGEIDFYQAVTYDNLNRTLQVNRHDTTASGNLIARSQTKHDDRGRAYQSIRYAVDPATGTVGNCLVDNTWYDPSGQVIKQLPSGSSAFMKSIYDGAGRQTVQYFGYDLGASESNYSSASDISDDTIVEQTETAYDAASNVIQTALRQRYHDATGAGALSYPGGAQPVARVSYVAMYPDAVGRSQATANYGTNGGIALIRPSTIPERADTVLVTSTIYNERAEAYQTIDPAGRVDQTTFDDAGRKTQQVDNVVASSSSSSSFSSSAYSTPPSDDKNRTTFWTYTADDQIATLTAENSVTGNQTTQYVYGTTLAESDIARNDLLRAVICPDSDDTASPLGNGPDGIYDRVEHTYNRLGQVTQTKDQNQTIHAFDFDLLGRQVQDRVISFLSSSSSSSSSSSGPPSGIDSTVQRIGRTYEVRGLPLNVTSYSSPIVGQGIVVNDVQFVYNSFGQLVAEYQEHSGAVNTSTSVNVQYQYADGSANTIRPTSITYPNGRVLNYSYGTVGGIGEALSRITSLIDNDGVTHIVDYTRLGRGTFVQQNSLQPQIAWSLINGSGADPYSGLDQFNRVIDNRWYSTASSSSSSSSSVSASADLDRIQHGYDRASNRLWRKNTVAETAGAGLDEFYTYDGMYELVRLDRGQLNSSNTGTVSGTLDYAQAWGLDATGNWQQFREDATGTGSWGLTQSRTCDRFNKITGISGGWAQPVYDLNGNMTAMPQPDAPISNYVAIYDAWSRLVEIQSNNISEGRYAYDGGNRRIVKAISSISRHYHYSASWQVLEERLGAFNAVDRQHVWGLRNIDDLLLRDSGNDRLYALTDPHRNIVAICDSAGDIRERFCYSAFGKPLFLDALFGYRDHSAYSLDILYAGYRFDEESSLLCVRYRMLHCGLGRWCTTDPLYSAESRNAFVYVANSPIKSIDPSGCQPDDAETQDPDRRPGTFLVNLRNCGYSCYGNASCCCTHVTVAYTPTEAEKARCLRIYIKVAANTQVSRHCCPDQNKPWHRDKPKDKGAQVDWVQPSLRWLPGVNSKSAEWNDCPGGASRGALGGRLCCPGACAWTALSQDFEGCAYCLTSMGHELNLGCTQWGHRCSYTFSRASSSLLPQLSSCVVKCKMRRYGGGINLRKWNQMHPLDDDQVWV